jgi:hypothetical protein
MKINALTSFAIASVIWLLGCGGQPGPSAQQKAAPQQRAVPKPQLTRDAVLQRFRERATAEQLREFEQLRTATDTEGRTRALELVLFTLTRDELFKIGIKQAGGFAGWAVADSSGASNIKQAVSRALEPEGISAMANCGLGRCNWYVPREQFFRARRALLAATNLNGVDLTVDEPMFSLQ